MGDKEYFEKAVGSLITRKARRYVSDPSEAPEDAEVEEGPQGGYYYETEGEDEPAASQDPADVPDDADARQHLEEIDTSLSRDQWVTVDTENVGEIRGTIDNVTESSIRITDENGQERGIPAEDILDWDVSEEDRTRNEIMSLDEGEPVTVDTENLGEIEGTVIKPGQDGSSLRIMDEGGEERGIPVQDIHDIDRDFPPREGNNYFEAELTTNYDEGDTVTVDTERVGEITGQIQEHDWISEYGELILEEEDGTTHTIPIEDLEGLE